MARKSVQNRIVGRAGFIACVFAACALAIVARLFFLQIISYEEYQKKVIEQMTVETEVAAARGDIYDSNMNILASTTTTWRVFISPRDIQNSKNKNAITTLFDFSFRENGTLDVSRTENQDELIARGLSEILGVDYDTIYQKTQKKNRRDETIKKNVDEETVELVRRFIKENNLSNQVHIEATSSRYYNYATLASNVIGFTGSDNQGLYGLEASYDKELSGTPGRYVTAQDAKGSDMPFEYSSLVEPIDGYDLVTTLDLRIQYELERQLRATYDDSLPQNRVCGIVMDVKTGGILGMATYPDFDLNAPFTLNDFYQGLLDSSGYEAGSDEYSAAKTKYLQTMWSNKPVTELYEPGSTFKIITCAMALEENKVSLTDQFTCPGYYVVSGVRIRCHKHEGHGTVSFARGLQQSCNPVMMMTAERVGTELFYKYFKAFGYTEKTGIDLLDESKGIFHELGNFRTVELATASFGQRFKVTPLQQLSAICAVANGGKLVTPHLMKYLLDGDGNIVEEYDTDVKRQVISAETAKTLSAILEEGVSTDGGARNAYVKGYKVAAKTGTSEVFDILDENGNSYLRIGSCVGYAPADDPQIAIIIMVDQPTVGSKYGSTVAAPYVADFFEAILPYIGVEPTYTSEELASLEITVGDYVGLEVAQAKKKAASQSLAYEVVGQGEIVTSQVPSAGSTLSPENSRIILYTGDESALNSVSVPNVVGKFATNANKILVNSGLNVKITGAQNYNSGSGAVVVSQSPAAGTAVTKGSIVTIEFRHMDVSD
jgi:stage V sporulation protein D (sporulation-specific penicillin-binding protein)